MLDSTAGLAPEQDPEEQLILDIDGFEGPLDLLLALARSQKVDLRRISVLALAEQYLSFIEKARRLRIELAADYLVMAAWLAYLKSRLLLPPEPSEDGESAEDMAERLAWRLARLEAIRKVAAQLMARDQLGRDIFARGAPEAVTLKRQTVWEATLADLLNAYGRVKTRESYAPLHLDRPAVFSLEEAIDRLSGLVGDLPDWEVLSAFLPEGWRIEPARRRSALASTFAAMLELARRGKIEIEQGETFAPIRLRARAADADTAGQSPA